MRIATPRPLPAALAALLVALVCALALASGGGTGTQAHAGKYLAFSGPGDGYIEVSNDAALKPTAAVTWEAWVFLESYGSAHPGAGQPCVSIAGGNFFAGTWFGLCEGHPRFYPQASVYVQAGGTVPLRNWAHVAVTYDGAEVRFYINGLPDSHLAFSGAMAATDDPLRIGSDVFWPYPPDGGLDEVRLWNVARGEFDIFGAKDVTITAPQPGLVAAWNMDGSPNADVGGFGGALSGDASFEDPPATPTPSPGPYRKGDVDCNGIIQPRDILPILAFAAGSAPQPACTNDPTSGASVDIDCSGAVDSADALPMLRALAALVAGLPEGCDPVGTLLE